MKEAHAAKMFPSWRIAIIWMARRYTIESMYVGQSVQHAPNSKEMIKKIVSVYSGNARDIYRSQITEGGNRGSDGLPLYASTGLGRGRIQCIA